MLLGRAKAAVIAAASTLLTACPALITGKVRADDKAWLNTKCPAEGRKAAQELGVLQEWAGASLIIGPNVIEHEYGVEVRDGPVQVKAGLVGAEEIPVRLFGELRTGSDGASIHLTRAKRVTGGEGDSLALGPEFPFCAIVSVRGYRHPSARDIPGMPDSPGIPKKEFGPFPPASELHPGYVLVETFQALMVEIVL